MRRQEMIKVGNETLEMFERSGQQTWIGEPDTITLRKSFSDSLVATVTLNLNKRIPYAEFILFEFGFPVAILEPSNELLGMKTFRFNGEDYCLNLIADKKSSAASDFSEEVTEMLLIDSGKYRKMCGVLEGWGTGVHYVKESRPLEDGLDMVICVKEFMNRNPVVEAYLKYQGKTVALSSREDGILGDYSFIFGGTKWNISVATS